MGFLTFCPKPQIPQEFSGVQLCPRYDKVACFAVFRGRQWLKWRNCARGSLWRVICERGLLGVALHMVDPNGMAANSSGGNGPQANLQVCAGYT